MVLTLYQNPLSQPVRSLLIFLKQNNIPFVGKEINVTQGEHLSEEYKSINPFSKIPAIDDDGFKLTESIAILQYLVNKHKVPDHWYPSNLQQRARIDEYLAWHHTNLRPGAALVVKTEFFMPRITHVPVNEEILAKRISILDQALHHLENYFLKDTSFISSSQISIADLMAVCELSQLELSRKDPREGYPKVAAWMNRVEKVLEPCYTEVHKVLYKVSDKNNRKAKL